MNTITDNTCSECGTWCLTEDDASAHCTWQDNTNGAGGERLKTPSPVESGVTPDARAVLPPTMNDFEPITEEGEYRYRLARISSQRLALDAASYLDTDSSEDSFELREFYLKKSSALALASLALSQAFRA